jgi:ketosteroid isomerase-like protein
MRQVFLLVAISITSALSPAQAKQDDDRVEAEIRRLHEEQRVAFLKKDVATLERIFSPTFIVTNPFGQVLNAQQTLDRVRRGEIDFARFDRELDYVKVYGDTVIAAGRETMVPQGKMKGAGSVLELRITTVWHLENGRWREIARHTSEYKTGTAK